ncbi:prephenate dehydratase [Mesobacillus maritimus]|uniref:prephenate dehydratase n=1 Tax=Mesobacillus maritimus TaxID=1643336 RepID=UPI00203FDE2B|nr:prephenate dehydratase [Mesobacillus maritimus]MCM3587683.1 prephenate dehydratase [Mesobacillus maritimus]MCM3669928.1 prephenate dehydratase [Mesobacillus maritimus]
MKIGYLGPVATFTDLAVRSLFPQEESIPYVTIPECIDSVADGVSDIAVVPIENALEGSVNITLDYLIHEVPLRIVGEATAPIQQHLMVHPENQNRWKEAELILSHSHALAQCHKFLHREMKGVASERVTSTAAAAQFVMEHPERNIAAIANGLAAEEYGLSIVQANIHDYDHNHTRFVVLSKEERVLPHIELSKKGEKTTIVVTLPSDRTGALHQVLSAFSWRNLNLSKIESRPTKTGLGNYFFIIDIEQQMDEVLIPGAMAELEALGCSVKVLGSYPSFKL